MSRRLLVRLAVGVLAVAGLSEWWWLLPRIGTQPLPAGYADDGRSDDLPADIYLMWQTGPTDWVDDPARRYDRASTIRAIDAASRVFATAHLVGKTRAEVITLLGDPRTSTDSIYTAPYHRAPWGALVYRFDNGAFGWQFDIRFNWWGTVRRVDRLRIL